MKYLILPMALMSAFFVSANEPDLDDLVSPKQVPEIKYFNPNNSLLFNSPKDAFESRFDESQFCEGTWSCTIIDESETVTGTSVKYYRKYETYSKCGYPDYYKCNRKERGFAEVYPIVEEFTYSCPPDNRPLHKIPVPINPVPTDGPKFMCAKPLDNEPDPNAKCDEFGNNSMLPPKAGVGSEGQNACYTNPSNGLSCQYVQGGDNFTATGKQCTGDENDYGDRPTPEPPPDGADPNCYNYGSQGQVLICDVDPNEGCNPLTINGTTQYQCPSGCGSIDGVYFCSYDDKDGDGIPDDKNGNGVPDKDETCVNGKCKPNTPDDTTPPTTEKPDMTETNTRLDGVIGELDSIGGKINKTNQTLDGINSGIQGIKQGQDKTNGLLTGMSKDTGLIANNTDAIAGNTKGLLETVSKTDVGNTFNPDLSTGFYESSYENGFEGIWAEKSILFEQTETIQFLQQFRFNAGGSPPDTQLCFNMGGSMDFGCADLPTPSPQLLAILKIFILITAAFLCRALIFGG
ncbi:MAG: hypothetical protein [Inoviridae sp.]|nr:MAG: hypothetical protein [Inoviridae sp.]